MKTTLFLLSCVMALALVVAVPAWLPGDRAPDRDGSPNADGGVLQGSVESGMPCRLEIVAGPETAFDRGTMAGRESGELAAGSFRFWEEPTGMVLYVYDDVQNLLGRVVNPKSVRVLEPARAQ